VTGRTTLTSRPHHIARAAAHHVIRQRSGDALMSGGEGDPTTARHGTPITWAVENVPLFDTWDFIVARGVCVDTP
jgi:hypothetical protein